MFRDGNIHRLEMITAKELREIWIRFFTNKGFFDVSNRSVIPPESDKSLLFINSGVAAIKSYFCGDLSRPSSRLVSAQRVIRTGDIENIGESFRHNTYFEMLGNFCIGETSREEAISLAWELLVDVLGLDREKIYVTVFEEDKVSADIWGKYIPNSRIIYLGKESNFWDMGVGPCGPCTEIYFDRGNKYDAENIGVDLLVKNIENERYLEIWNIVFSDFLNVDGKIVPSPTKNLDTGAGLERLLSVLQEKDNNFETTLFVPILEYLAEYLGVEVSNKLWAPADYFRTSCVLLRDGVVFGNKGREYVLRRIFRKACSILELKYLNGDFFKGLVRVVSESLDYYDWDIKEIIRLLISEYGLIRRQNRVSKNLLNDLLDKYQKEIPAVEIFNLVTRNGLPITTIESLLQNRVFDKRKYEALIEEHKKKSFNSKISSAFIKQIPVLLEKAIPTEVDYLNREGEGIIDCIYVGDEFNRYTGVEEGDLYLVLDKTVVFPNCAGQEADDGFMYVRDRCIPILNSLKAPNGQILHRIGLDKALREGDRVRVEHIVEKRRKISMNHTAEHLLYSVLKKLVHKNITRVSGNKREDCFVLEIKGNMDREMFDLLEINKALDEAIGKAIDVKTYWGTLDKAKEMGIVGCFEEIYEIHKDKLRFVDIGEYGTELCIGTHVRNTKDIEAALITRFNKEQKDIYRFQVITGREEVDEFLKGKESKEGYLRGLQNREEAIKERKIKEQELFLGKKKEIMHDLLNSRIGKISFLEKKVEMDVAMAVFKEIRGYLNNQVIVLYFKDEEGIRFFVASQGIDISSLFGYLREKGGKCGGNSSFGSGICYREDIRDLFSSWGLK